MKNLFAVSAMIGSCLMASASEAKEIRITGAAAEELLVLVGETSSKNITCRRELIPACDVCDGGVLVAECTLQVDKVNTAQED